MRLNAAPAAVFSALPAAGGDQAAGLSRAIAVLACEGGAPAEAFAQALADALAQPGAGRVAGCSVLTSADTTANTRCGSTSAFAAPNSTFSQVRRQEGRLQCMQCRQAMQWLVAACHMLATSFSELTSGLHLQQTVLGDV